MLSHAFMGDDNIALLDFEELSASERMLGLGCIDTQSTQVEDIQKIEDLVKKAIQKVPKERIAIHPDCGLRLLPRDIALEKMKRMVIASRRASQL